MLDLLERVCLDRWNEYLCHLVNHVAGKAIEKPFPKAQQSTSTLEIVHSDIRGPLHIKNRQGTRYFITFIDDYSWYGHVYLISHKSKSIHVFEKFTKEVQAQFNKKIQTLRTDGGVNTPQIFSRPFVKITELNVNWLWPTLHGEMGWWKDEIGPLISPQN